MTWSEIKKAVEEAGITETDDIRVIECENLDGNKHFHKSRLGAKLNLKEQPSESERESAGCAT